VLSGMAGSRVGLLEQGGSNLSSWVVATAVGRGEVQQLRLSRRSLTGVGAQVSALIQTCG
jgi:hypothetical protein